MVSRAELLDILQPPIPHDLPDYHQRQAALVHALEQANWQQVLEYLYLQCHTLICAENLQILITTLQALGWDTLRYRAETLQRILFPASALNKEKMRILQVYAAKPFSPPSWLVNWLLPPTPPRLSICMILRNAADFLEAALASIQALAWEIIAVDTGSEDQTKEIAQAYAVQWYEIPWPEDFSAARNYSLQKARGDWILIVDADETLDAESVPLFKEFLSFAPMGWNLFLLTQHHLSDHPSQSFFIHTGRLFRNHPDLRFQGAVHEQVHRLHYPWYLYPIYLAQIRLIHHGYTAAQRQKHAKEERNQRLLEKTLAQPPYQNPYYWLHKGHLLMHQQPPDLTAARMWLERALSASIAQFGKIPPAPGWSSAPINLNLFFALELSISSAKTKRNGVSSMGIQTLEYLCRRPGLGRLGFGPSQSNCPSFANT